MRQPLMKLFFCDAHRQKEDPQGLATPWPPLPDA